MIKRLSTPSGSLAMVGLLCGLVAASRPALSQPQRTYANRSWVLIWKDGGRISDTTFGWVREHTASDMAIYVLDAGTLQIHAYHPVQRRLMWSAGRKGSGPGEFLAPVDIATTGNGVAVLDPANGRISEYDVHGRHLRDLNNAILSRAKAMCVMADGSTVLNTSQSDSYLIRISREGRVLYRWRFPWKVEDPENPMLTSTTTIRGNPSGRCYFAPTFGFGVIHVDSNNQLRTTKLIENYPAPTFRTQRGSNGLPGLYLDKGTNASLGGFHWGDTLGVIAMSAQGKLAGLDLYEKESGKYLKTWMLPPDERFVWSNRTLVGLSASAITQSLRVWADTSDTLEVLRRLGVRKTAPVKKPTPRASTPARPSAPARVPPRASR
jgi:hypothetical protein